MTKNLYDAVVVGTDLAGLMAAGLLQRRGYRVLLIGQGGLRDRFDLDGNDIAALPQMIPARGSAPILDGVLKDLGVEDPVHQMSADQEPHIQIVTPRQRIDLFRDPKHLEEELGRAVPDQRQAFLDQIARLRKVDAQFQEILRNRLSMPSEGILNRFRLGRLETALAGLGTLETDRWPTLLRILYRATAFLSHLDIEVLSPPAIAHLLLGLLDGPRTVADFSLRVINAIEKAGVDVRLSSVAEELFFEGGRVAGLRLMGSHDIDRAGVMLASLPLSNVVELVPTRMRRQRERLTGESLRLLRCTFAFHVLIPKEALPLGMANNLALVPSLEAPWAEENLIRVQCVAYPPEPRLTQVCFACIVPQNKVRLGREYLGPLQKRLLQAARWLIPFLDEHLRGLASPFWNSRASDSNHPAPWSLHMVVETGKPPSLGIGVHPIRTGLKGMLLCGTEVVPGLGVEGEALSALQAVRWLEENRKIRHPL